MSVNNITRDEARERARLLDVDRYVVDLDLTTGPSTFRSTSEVTFACSQPGSGSYLDLTAATVHEVVLNGESLDPAEVFDGNRVQLHGLAASNSLRVVADCPYMRTGEGLHRFVDPVDDAVYLYTQFETFDAHRMYGCFDQPDLKAQFAFRVTAPAGWQVVSNAPVESCEPSGDAIRVTFAATPQMSTYITALVAGPYHRVTDSYVSPAGVEIPLGLYCRSSLAQHLDADALFEVTKQGFDFFHATFDYPYAFAKYDQLFVPEFNAGAMENAGCVTFLEDYVFRSKVTDYSYERRAETILHEMAHMWFGDLVTMRWWDDLWLNESFASYAAVLAQSEATRWTSAWTTFANVEKTWAYRQDQLPSTHPIASDIIDIEAVRVNFDGITYAKGASVLKQLVAWVGRDEFIAGLRAYFRTHEWSNTSLQDLLDALEQSSGRDLSAWSKQWLETAGVNTLRPSFETDDRGAFTSFAVLQEAPADWPTLRSHRVAIGLYDLEGDQLARRERVEVDVIGDRTEVPALAGQRQPDLVLVNDDDLTYAKIRLDPRSLTTLTQHIGGFESSLPRTLCWAAAWDMMRDAELAARDYIALVLGGIGQEPDVGVVQSLLAQVRSALMFYTDPAHVPTARQQIADAAHEALRSAAPGSDLQLTWARAFATYARSDEHLARVRRMLDGSEPVEGLAVDTDMRWHLLRQLAIAGCADDAEIDAELKRDSTAAGERHATTIRAARPSAEAKAEAWRSVVDSDDLPNAMQAAVIAGFQQPEHVDVLRAYVEPYFASISDIWRNRTHEMATGIVEGLYPSLLIEQATIDRTDAFLRTDDVPPALRRLLLEGRAGVVRALRGRERDAAAAG
ncbi:MAG: aminopeptidase N [Frankiaceae bacterium]